MKRKIIFLITVFLLFNVIAKSRNLDTSAIRSRTQDAGLIFIMNSSPNLSLDDYEGGAGFIYYLLNDIALRGSIGIDYERIEKPATLQNKPDAISEKTGVSFLTGIRFNLISNLIVIAYSGFEGLFSYHITSNENLNHSNIEPVQTIEDKSFGGGIFIGAEWFFVKNISLSLEYKLRYSKTWSNETITLESKDYVNKSAIIDKLNLTSKNFNVALTIYFN